MSRGFTLIEILMAIGILSGIVLVVSMFSLDVFDFQLFLSDAFVMQQEINTTLTEMGIEVRGMGPSANGSYPIESASATSFVFYADKDGNGTFDRIRYFVSGGSLWRGLIKPTGNPASYPSGNEVISRVVQNVILPPTAEQPLFVYFEKNYTGIQNPMTEPIDVNRVRLIKANITADRTPQDDKSRIEYFSLMMIRNLRNTP